MNYKFTVTCKACGCRTELSSGGWEVKGIFQCPNCKAQMQDFMFEALAAATGSLAILPNDSNEFSISINSPWNQER